MAQSWPRVSVAADAGGGTRSSLPRWRRWRRTLGAFIAATAVLVGLGVSVHEWAHADRVNLGVVYDDGVRLGSGARQESSRPLDERRNGYPARELRLRYGDYERLVPVESLSAAPAVEGRRDSAFQVDPQGKMAERPTHRVDAPRPEDLLDAPAVALDEERAAAFLARLAEQIDRPAVSARLSIGDDLEATVSPARAGRELDVDRALHLLKEALANSSPTVVDLPVRDRPPTVLEADLAPAKAEVEKMLSAPLTLRFADKRWILSREDIAKLLVVQGDVPNNPSASRVELNEDGLLSFVHQLAAQIDQEAQTARRQLELGTARVVRGGRAGYALDVPAALETIKASMVSDDRVVVLPVRISLPVGIAQYREGIKELVSSATTNYAGGLPERQLNVELAAARLNGALVGPGEVFSFNEELGPMTLEAGFKWGWGISRVEGKPTTVPSVAGGICQVSTTLFQALFWAGYQIEERNPHLYWIDRYGQPPSGLKGLDATVDQVYDARGRLVYAVDLKFKNTTQYPILIEAKTDGRHLTFNLYSTKPDWTVRVDPPVIENAVKADPGVIRQVDPSLAPDQAVWIELAQDGFQSTIFRTVVEPGKAPRTLKLVGTYRPSSNVALVGPASGNALWPPNPTPLGTDSTERAQMPAGDIAPGNPQGDSSMPPAIISTP